MAEHLSRPAGSFCRCLGTGRSFILAMAFDLRYFIYSRRILDEEIEQLIEERNQARSNRDFARSDEIRDLLKEKGILLEDTPQGTRWRREA